MFVNLQIDTTDPLSGTDQAVLRALLGETDIAPQAKPGTQAKKEPIEETGARLAKEAEARKQKDLAAAKAKKADPEPEPEVVPVEEPEPQPKKAPVRKPKPKPSVPVEEPAEPESEEVPSMEDAVERAQKLVGQDKLQDVKKVLADLGKKRVGELKSPKDIQAFLEATAGMVDDDE